MKTSRWIKYLAVFLVLCMVCCFAGCDGDKNQDSSDDSSNSSGVEIDLPDPRKVGYIFSGNADDKLSYTGQINEQRIKAANRCSMDTCYIDNVSITDFETAVKKLADEGCTDIVAASDIFANKARSLSSKYMNLNFISFGASSSTANLASYTEHMYQGAHVAGMVAAYNSKTLNIGFVSDSDLTQDVACANAAALGAQIASKNTTLFVMGAHADNEVEEAIDALINNNCDVIICYTLTKHAADYCQKKGVKFIANLDFTGETDKYSNMLMYFYAKRDSYFLMQFKEMQFDQWQSSNYVGNMGNGCVMVSKPINCKEKTDLVINAILPALSSEAAYIFSGEMIDNQGIVRLYQTDELSYKQIYEMNWFVKGVELLGTRRRPQGEPPTNNFEIKY